MTRPAFPTDLSPVKEFVFTKFTARSSQDVKSSEIGILKFASNSGQAKSSVSTMQCGFKCPIKSTGYTNCWNSSEIKRHRSFIERYYIEIIRVTNGTFLMSVHI